MIIHLKRAAVSNVIELEKGVGAKNVCVRNVSAMKSVIVIQEEDTAHWFMKHVQYVGKTCMRRKDNGPM